MFAQSRPQSGLVTQAEVRAIALAQLAIPPGGVVWDVGAGSGSVAVEAARLSEPGMVYAIEQDAADYHLILANAEAFGVRNLKAVHGSAGRVRRPAGAGRSLRRRPRPRGRPAARGGLEGAAARRADGRQRGDAGNPEHRLRAC